MLISDKLSDSTSGLSKRRKHFHQKQPISLEIKLVHLPCSTKMERCHIWTMQEFRQKQKKCSCFLPKCVCLILFWSIKSAFCPARHSLQNPTNFRCFSEHCEKQPPVFPLADCCISRNLRTTQDLSNNNSVLKALIEAFPMGGLICDHKGHLPVT